MDGSIIGKQPAWTLGAESHPPRQTTELMARVADDEDTLKDAWLLRYESYSHHAYIDKNPDRLFKDELDFKPTSKTIVIYQNEQAIGSVRVCLHNAAEASLGNYTMPAMSTFPDLIPSLLVDPNDASLNMRAVEVMRLVTHPHLEKNLELIFGLFRMAKYLTKFFDSQILFCGVRSNHIGIYRRIGFKKASEPRPYPKLKFDTALMYGLEEEYEIVQEKISFLSNVNRNDFTYSGLVNGDLVPVFGDANHATPIADHQKSSLLHAA